MSDKAKVVVTGSGQAVRLPKAYWFEQDEVWIRRGESTGDVILSNHPPDWSQLFALYDSIEIPGDFLDEEDHAQLDVSRDPFGKPRA